MLSLYYSSFFISRCSFLAHLNESLLMEALHAIHIRLFLAIFMGNVSFLLQVLFTYIFIFKTGFQKENFLKFILNL